ncbi:MAG: CusA/CzcA family heavy metal efflux RND transporter [bacterium]
MLRKLVELAAKNKFVVILFTAFAVAWGIWAIVNIPLDAIPDLSDVQVIVFTEWPGRSPDLVEDQITYPLVSSMLAAPRVKVVRGYSYFGLSFVNVIFKDGTDMYWARSRVLEYLSQSRDKLPPGVTPTLGPDATGVGWVFQYALVDKSGQNDLASLRAFQDWHLKYWLESVPGVAEVASVGGFEKTYQVKVDPNKLAYYGVPLTKVIMAIRSSNNDVGGRVVELSGKEYMVRGRGYINSLEDIETVAVGIDERGVPILIKNLGVVTYGPDMRRGIAELDGEGEVVGGIVVMRFGENALDVINRVKDKIKEVEGALPPGVEIVTTYDRSKLIKESIRTLVEKLFEEMLIVSLVCIIFLFHFRSSLVAIIMLPVAIIIGFIPMYYIGLTSNIMSLGGIAIAIGVMVDAAIVMVENAHKRLEQSPDADRRRVIVDAAKEMGKPLFFSLLVITVSFLPVFTLEAQEGRLFKPLAFTKTFAMFFASVISVTLVPVLMLWLIRGKIRPERKNPLSRALIRAYQPLVDFALRYPRAVIVGALVILVISIPAFLLLGSEFMPPLHEGTILYMPTTLPGIGVTTAGRLLQVQDKLFKTFPEVDTVFGKIGRADTATDPAPMAMVETTVVLKPKREWRKGMTYEKLIKEMDASFSFPGVTNAWTMPIKARIDMLTTGIKTPVGIKVFGPDLEGIGEQAQQLEAILNDVPGTRSVYAERVTGGYYLDITPDREALARYGLTVEEVERVVETAVGGMNVDRTVEGRERFGVNVRYFQDYRADPEALKRVLVPTPAGPPVPLGQIADIELKTGPPVIKDENGSLSGWVYIDIEGRSVGSYVRDAKKAVEEKLTPKPGYHIVWTGQYEAMERVRKRLIFVLPVTLAIIFVLLYFNFRSVAETLIVLLSVPFALVGAVWLMFILGYNMSIAVWVGIIALAGVAAETGVVMIVYLDDVYNRRRAEGRLRTLDDLREAVQEGAVQRVRPKMMTVLSTMLGLLPIMWSAGAGADVMKRIATPVVGGMVTSTLLTLVVIPAVYMLWRGWQLPRDNEPRPLKGFTQDGEQTTGTT